MKSIGRLIRGELYKFWKSKILFIMTAILVVVISIMSIIYANYDKQVSGMLSMMLGGEQRVTSFDLLDGKATDLLEQAGIKPEDLGLGGAGGFEEAFKQIQNKPELKAMLVATDPAVLQSMEVWTKPIGSGAATTSPMMQDIGAALPGFDLKKLIDLQRQFMSYGGFAPLQRVVANDYLNDYISSDANMNKRVEELLVFLKDDGQYGHTVVEFINVLIDRFYDNYKKLAAAATAFNAVANDGNISQGIKEEKWGDVLATYYLTVSDFNSVKFFTKSNMFSTNFLLISSGAGTVTYQQFAKSLEAFESSSFKDAMTNYKKVLQSKTDKDTWAVFQQDFYALLDPAYVKLPIVPSAYALPSDTADGRSSAQFLTNINSVIGTVNKDSIFSFESNAVKAVFEKIQNGTLPEALSSAEKTIYDSYVLEDGTIDPLLPAHKAMNISIAGEITEKIYNDQIRPYYEEKEKPLIDAASAALNTIQTRYSDAGLMYGLLGEGFLGGLTKAQYASLYSDYRKVYAEHASRTATAKNLIVNVNLYESVEAAGLNDQDAKKIQGFLMSSRYNLRSEVTKAQYLISSDHLASEYVAPETLGGGWGMMQFVFELSSVIILVFGIVLGAGAIAGEHTNGTMKLLLIRPHRRWQVLTAKLLSIIIVMIGFYIINFFLTFCIGAIGWGITSLPALSILNSASAVVLAPASVLLLQHLFSMIETIIFVQIALTLSTVIKSRSGAVAVSMLVYFVSFILSMLLSSFSWYRFIIFNNTNLKQYMTSMGPSLADMTLGFSIVVDIVYIIAFTVIGLLTFNKRDAT